MKLTKEIVENEIKRLDQNLNPEEEDFKIATILLASLQTGTEPKKISKFLNIPIKDIKKYEKNLIKNQIWVGDKVQCNWFDKEEGGVSFWLDVLVAKGYIEKTKDNIN